MGRKTIDGKPVFGPEEPPKKEINSKFSNNSSLKKLVQYIYSGKFCIEGYRKLVAEEINKSGGVKQFLENNKEFAPEFKKIVQRNGNKVAKLTPKKFPKLGLKEEELKESYKQQLKIYDEIISSNKENYSEEKLSIIGEGGNDQAG